MPSYLSPVETESGSARIAARTSGFAELGDQRVEGARRLHQAIEGRALHEGMAGREAEQHAEGPVRDLGSQLAALLLRGARGVEELLPEARSRERLQDEEGDRDLRLDREPAHPLDLLQRVLGILAVDARGGDLEDDGLAGLRDRVADREELVLLRVGPGDGIAGEGDVGLQCGRSRSRGRRPGRPRPRASPSSRCRRRSRARSRCRAAPSRRSGGRRGRCGLRCPSRSGADRGRRDTAERSPTPKRARRAARRPECLRPTPSWSRAGRDPRAAPARSRCRRRRARRS